jgi:chemosensory pili system protein ChpA (sensor histidine kinase/response regulator)
VADRLPRVLIVEDDRGLREALAECIESMGFEVATACDGAEGLERLGAPDLPSAVLLDLGLPGLDGDGFLSAMRRDARVAGVPVISMTAFHEGPRLPVHRHLEKPFDLDEIARLLRGLCAPPA